MSIRTPLGRVRGLGSAKKGAEHFWHQRLTAAALVPLTLWFVWSLVALSSANYEVVVSFFANPIQAALMLLFVWASLFHMLLGLQVVIEDYVRHEGARIVLLLVIKMAAFLTGALCTLSVLRMAAGS